MAWPKGKTRPVNHFCTECGALKPKGRLKHRICGSELCKELDQASQVCTKCGLAWNRDGGVGHEAYGKYCPRCRGMEDVWPKMKVRKCLGLDCDKEYLSLEYSDRFCPKCRILARHEDCGQTIFTNQLPPGYVEPDGTWRPNKFDRVVKHRCRRTP